MSRYLICSIISFFLLVSCCTTKPNPNQITEEQSVGSEDYKKLDDIELKLLSYIADANAAALAAAENDCLMLLENLKLNKEYEARVHGLYGEIMFYSGKTRAAKTALNAAEAKSKKTPQIFILKALLESKSEEKLKILEEGIQAAPESGRLAFYLAESYFTVKEYGKAVGAYDEAFARLDAAYKTHYQDKRDLAKKLNEDPDHIPPDIDYTGIKALLVSDVLKAFLMQSSFFETISPKKDIDLKVLLDKLKEKKYIYLSNLDLPNPLERKDFAYLVLAIIARFENKPEIMDAYAKQYKAENRSSPVPDVAVADYFFDAVLNLVEREIMELPDGTNFFPGKTVSGLELYDILKKLTFL